MAHHTEAYAIRRKVVVAEVTTRLRGAPTEIRLGRAEGPSRPSVVTVENLVTVPKEWLRARAGALSRQKIVQINEALRCALELPWQGARALSRLREL